MTTVEMIGVQGIRSFSPSKMETLGFEKPLTLIVGHNGSGKTVGLIECLKVVTTGELPPNVDKGKNFIHDPKIDDVAEVRAQIKLTFKAYNGNMVCATRMYQLYNIKDKTGKIKPSFKALESVLQVKSPNGQESCVSHKCVDMDLAVPSLIGLSKAVLDSVIFCHQENNTWPLSDNATVKKRFDDLFQTSRYVKALEAIAKARREQAEAIRDKKSYLEVCKTHYNQAKSYQRQLADYQMIVNELEGQIKKHEADELELQNKIDREKLNESDLVNVKGKAEKLRAEISNINGRVEEIKNNLSEEYQEGLDALLQMQIEFNQQMKQANESLLTISNEIKKLENTKSTIYLGDKWEGFRTVVSTIGEKPPINLQELVAIKEKLEKRYDKKISQRGTQIYDFALKELDSFARCLLCQSTLSSDGRSKYLESVKKVLCAGGTTETECPLPHDFYIEIEKFVKQVTEQERAINEKINVLEDGKNQVEEQIDNFKEINKNLLGNIKLKTLQQDCEKLEEETTEYTSILPQLYSELNAKSSQKHECLGSLKARKDMIKEIELKLESPLYKNAKDKLTDAQIQLETIMLAEKDLACYQKSLDLALTKYHSKKVEEINLAIKSIWQELYTGNDIDYIAVRFNQESDKSFQYLIVMSMNGIELDMRGRCSAGQRMMASLVIRLALAETFCQNCGILALDEPTTNLDTSHIRGLEESLARLVSERRGLSGFQLIVITHDEEFASKLALDCGCQRYYRIDKLESGSRITAVNR